MKRLSSRKTQYDLDGFFTGRSCFTRNEVTAMRDELDRLWAGVDISDPPPWVHWRQNIDGQQIADRMDPICPQSEVFSAACEQENLQDLVSDLLGGKAFVLKAKVIMKRPGTKGYGVHQDLAYWDNIGVAAGDVLTAAIALDDVSVSHGPLELYGRLHHDRLPPDPDNPLDVDPEFLKTHAPEIVTMQAGDVSCFHSLVPHASGPNTAEGPRRMFLITFAKGGERKDEIIARYEAQVAETHAVHRQGTEG